MSLDRSKTYPLKDNKAYKFQSLYYTNQSTKNRRQKSGQTINCYHYQVRNRIDVARPRRLHKLLSLKKKKFIYFKIFK